LLILDGVVYIVSGVKSPIPGGSAQFLLASPAGFAFVAAFTRGAVAELVQRYEATKLLDELNEAHAQLRAYADQVERLVVARERNRMAREIHDTLGHYLTVINVQIETAQKLRDRDAASSADALVTAKQLATECLNEVRRSVSALRPAALEDGGLLCAVDLLVEGLRGAAEFAIHLDVEGNGRLPVETEVTVYRAIQEALTNARKHARARNVWIKLAWEANCLVATIRDDGQGTKNDSTADAASFGLQAMRERLSRVGGVLDIETGGGGFCVTVTVPLVQRLEAVPS
jgi:signal transduction histidine kinase